MSDSTVHNLLLGTATGDVSKWKIGKGWGDASITSDAVDGYQCIIHEVPYGWQVMYQPLPSNLAGKLVTLSGYAKITSKNDITEKVIYGANNLNAYYTPFTEISDSWTRIGCTFTLSDTPMLSILTRVLPEGNAFATVAYRELMLVEGTEPAAWAPAEGEQLAGGGALMSANLLDGVKPEITQYGSMTDGVITSSTQKADWKDVAIWPITTGKFAENQTMHLGISAKWHGKAATTGVAYAAVKYADAAGSTNIADIPISGITTEWKRFSLSAVIPSGMHIVDFHISGDKLDAAYDATNPVLSYGSAVRLASSAHTPYATQDHVMVTYATKAQLKVTDDSVKAEVSARAQTDSNVADLSSRLTQTANSLTSEISDRRSAIATVTGLANAAQSTATAAQTMATENQSSIKQLSTSITSEVKARAQTDRTVSDLSSRLTQTASGLSASISKLSETDKKVNAWFDFEADSSGNPQLKMGSSTSPVVGTYTNSGLAYKSRDGATIMELDASRSATISDHMEAQDMRVGKWKWVQTQGGTHLTLVWEG